MDNFFNVFTYTDQIMGINEGLSYTFHCALLMHKVTPYCINFYYYKVY